MRTILLAALVASTVVVSAAGPDLKYRAPRTENGQPDLQGVWNFSSDVPLQRPLAAGDQRVRTREEREQARTSLNQTMLRLIAFVPVENVALDWLDRATFVDDLRTSLISYPENGRLPQLLDGVTQTPSVEDIFAALADRKARPPLALLAQFGMTGPKNGPEDFGPSERCLFGADVPIRPQFSDNYLQIIQGRDHVVLLTDGDRRIIPLDNRPRVGERLRSWDGEPRGRWDGDTLVIETRNFNSRTRSFAGAGYSKDKVVTERISRTAKDGIQYEATVVDAKTFQDRVMLSFPMAKVDAHLYEWACHEGNYAMSNSLSAARTEERKAK